MSDIEDIRNMVTALLASASDPPTPDTIRAHIQSIRAIRPSVDDDQSEQLARELETIHAVTMSLGSVLVEEDFEPWLNEAKKSIDPFYWHRYKEWMASNGFSSQVLASLDDVTDRILGFAGNPRKEGPWDRRGMVVGHVQSGKTSNYIGLMCKAADAGYRVIIVIAGIHNNLRNQTQMRIDEGFVGFASAKASSSSISDRIIGAGNFRRNRRPNTFTNTLKDFNSQTAGSLGVPLVNLKEPAVFVIKKNSHTLRNLLVWLKAHNQQQGMSKVSEPMLLIDDEADNASINISRGRDEVSRINGQIRGLLHSFDRSTYMGYTATPFANIFVDPEDEDEMVGQDLFPRDFIVSLDPPDNYFGPEQVFGEKRERKIIRLIEDNEDWLPIKHRIDDVIEGLPDSLKLAVRTFIVASAIRLVRGQRGSHRSMLVNISRFTNLQHQVRNEIHTFLEEVKSSIRINGRSPGSIASDPEMQGLYRAFNYYRDIGVTEDWGEVADVLHDAASPIRVVEINSASAGTLDYSEYPNGLSVIAVGGFSLSRGLTLEGLTVSYFLRNSMMYDTLMQMGRWFGYRPNYGDLCQVWMPEEAEGWYAHISESVEELRGEIRLMEQVSATPKEFGLKVRSHPDSLIVTARNKMGAGTSVKVSVGLSNRFVETTALHRQEEIRLANYTVAVDLARQLRKEKLSPIDEKQQEGVLFRDVSARLVIDFIAAFQNNQASILSMPGPIIKYIEKRSDSELSSWNVFFPSLKKRIPRSLQDEGLGMIIYCQRRAPGNSSSSRTLYLGNKRRLASRGIEKTGLTPEEIADVDRRFKASHPDSENVPDKAYREVRSKPLLAVHLLAIGRDGDDLSSSLPHTAWSISFPVTKKEEDREEYVVNARWLAEQRWEWESDEGAEGEDE